MSYGIGIVIPKDDINKDLIRYDFCDWTLPITVQLYPESCKKSFIDWHKDFNKEQKLTSIDKLKTAPCDCVCIIDSEGNFDLLKDRNPIASNVDINKHL